MRGTCTCNRFPDEHPRQYLCGIGFNGFLGEVQHRLIKLGYEPPVWPGPKIRDQGDMDEALDVCVQWCATRLDEAKAVRPEGKPTKLWLWKNFVDGRPEYWAFDNPYPTHGGGDPMTLGEPCGYAIFKESTVAPGRVDVPESEVIAAIKRAHSSPRGTT